MAAQDDAIIRIIMEDAGGTTSPSSVPSSIAGYQRSTSISATVPVSSQLPPNVPTTGSSKQQSTQSTMDMGALNQLGREGIEANAGAKAWQTGLANIAAERGKILREEWEEAKREVETRNRVDEENKTNREKLLDDQWAEIRRDVTARSRIREENKALRYAKEKELKESTGFKSAFSIVDSLRGTIGGAGGPLVGAGLDITSAVTKSIMGEVTGMAAAIPVVGAVIAGFVAAVKGAGTALVDLKHATLEIATGYAKYSPDVAIAQAIGSLNQTLGDIRRANQIGPQLARYLQNESAAQQRLQDVMISIVDRNLPALNNINQGVNGFQVAMLHWLNANIQGVPALLNAILPGIADIVNNQNQNQPPPPFDPNAITIPQI